MYQIILYNNGKRAKKIKSYISYGKAIKKYRDLLSENKVYFPKEILWDGSKTDYELVLTAPIKNKGKDHFRNELGALIKIKPKGNFVIKQVEKYQIEDTITNKLTGKKLDFKSLIKTLVKKQFTYVLIVIHNKLIIERFENDDVDLYVLKNNSAATLLCHTIQTFNNANNQTNFIYFDDPTLDTRVRIYDMLEERYGISRVYMRRLTTH